MKQRQQSEEVKLTFNSAGDCYKSFLFLKIEMFGHRSITLHKINNKSMAVKLSLTQSDIDQDVLLTLLSHACQELLFLSCQAVITKPSH